MAARIASMLITWEDTAEFDPVFSGLAALGYEGVEFSQPLTALGNMAAMRDRLRSHRLSAVSLLCEGDLLDRCSPEFEESKKRIEAAAEAGVEVIDIVGGWISGPEQKTAENFRSFTVILSELAAYAASLGMQTALHNHMGSLAETEEDIRRIFNEGSGFGLCLDTAHFVLAGEDPKLIAEEMCDRLHYIHLKDYRRGPEERAGEWYPERFCELGEGNIGLDFSAFLHAVSKLRYSGWLTVELDRPQPGRTAMESAGLSRTFLRRIGI
jgi:inosose dehydratase